MENNIWTISEPSEEKFLRRKTKPFDFAAHSKPDIKKMVELMRKSMREANGIGLSANQIGLPWRVFVAEVPDSHGEHKFYAIFNPKLEKEGSDKIWYEEGCLSVPRVFGQVERPERVLLTGQDKNGRTLKIKAWGLLARVFQHEVDHLEGKVFLDHKPKLRETNVPTEE